MKHVSYDSNNGMFFISESEIHTMILAKVQIKVFLATMFESLCHCLKLWPGTVNLPSEHGFGTTLKTQSRMLKGNV